MSNPSPTALVIASLIESALAPIFTTMSAPLLARIEELEKTRASLNFTPEQLSQIVTAVTDDSGFDEAVLSVIEDRSGEVIDNLGDDLVDKVKETQSERVGDIVADVIRSGSFNIEFTRY